MNAKRYRALVIVVLLICSSSLATDRLQVTAAPPLPALTLPPGDSYFRIDGKSSFIFARNVTGYQQSQYETILDWAQAGGSKLARIQLDSLGAGMTSDGLLDESWARRWEAVIDKAYDNGIYVLPVFSGWFDWNNGTPDYGYSTWAANPLNSVNGGPAKTPAELFRTNSVTQSLWLRWMASLVTGWQSRKNIAAWEIFSEINIATGTSEAIGIDFLERAASLIRAADPARRPITLSLADVGEWPDFYRSKALDFIEIHPYPISGQLDRYIMAAVREKLEQYNKPVLIGESGLSASTPDSTPPTLTTAKNAGLGIEHAIWASIVSGAMNGRTLYWEDSYGIYFKTLGVPWLEKYATVERPAAAFLENADFSGFRPLEVDSRDASLVVGGAVGNQTAAIGWFRDAGCEPPDWKVQPKLANQRVGLAVPGSAASWQMDFYDTETETKIGSIVVSRERNSVTIPLPDFRDAIAFKMTAKS